MTRKKPPMKKPSTHIPPANKEPVNISLRLASELSKKLERYCSMTGVSKNGVICLALSDFLSSRI